MQQKKIEISFGMKSTLSSFKLISSPSTKNELGERERVCVCVFENAKEKVATIRTIKQSIKSIQKEQNK